MSSSEAKQKINELAEKIRALRLQRESMNPQSTVTSPPKKAKSTTANTSTRTSTSKLSKTKKEKKHFHPNLDIVVAEMANSPYLTAPLEKYSSKSIRLGPELMKIRFEGKVKGAKIKKKDIPCDLKTAKKVWKKEIDEFDGSYNSKPRTVKMPSPNKKEGKSLSSEAKDSKKLNIV